MILIQSSTLAKLERHCEAMTTLGPPRLKSIRKAARFPARRRYQCVNVKSTKSVEVRLLFEQSTCTYYSSLEEPLTNLASSIESLSRLAAPDIKALTASPLQHNKKNPNHSHNPSIFPHRSQQSRKPTTQIPQPSVFKTKSKFSKSSARKPLLPPTFYNPHQTVISKEKFPTP